MVIRLLILGCLVAYLALAGAAAKGLETRVMISKQDCRWLVHHQPAADVAYKPGVGVRGRPVKPADLDSTRRITLPKIIAVPLHVPVGSLLKEGFTSPVGNSEVDVGLVTVDRTSGEVLYEGETLVSAEAERMIVACRELLHRKQRK